MDMNIVQNRKRKDTATHSVTNTKGSHKRKRVYVPRKTRKFQLRTTHPQDMHVAEILDYARGRREEVTMIRNAVQLEYSLGQGDTSLLLDRFPWLLEALKPLIAPPPDNTDLLNEILANQRKLMEQGITAPLPPTGGLTMTAQPASTGKTLGGFKQLEAPKWEDDDDELPQLTTTKNMNNDSVKNFLNAMSGIAH